MKVKLATCSFNAVTVRSPSIQYWELLLFRKTVDGVRFEGEMVYEGHHFIPSVHPIARAHTGMPSYLS